MIGNLILFLDRWFGRHQRVVQERSKIVLFSEKMVETKNGKRILILRFSGFYAIGSSGSTGAKFIVGAAEKAFEKQRVDGVILDFQKLDYQWGDNLEEITNWNRGLFRDTEKPLVVLVGDKSKESFYTLYNGIYSGNRDKTDGWVFENEDDGLLAIIEKVELS